jgi:hypothetical protein
MRVVASTRLWQTRRIPRKSEAKHDLSRLPGSPATHRLYQHADPAAGRRRIVRSIRPSNDPLINESDTDVIGGGDRAYTRMGSVKDTGSEDNIDNEADRPVHSAAVRCGR